MIRSPHPSEFSVAPGRSHIDVASQLPRSHLLHALARVAARLLQVPLALVSLVGEPGSGAESLLWGVAATDAETSGILSALEDPRQLATPAVAGEFFAFHHTHAVRGADGESLGAIHIMDHASRTVGTGEETAFAELAALISEGAALRWALGRAARTVQALHATTRGVGTGTGDEFFRRLVRELTQVLNVEYAFVAETSPGRDRAQLVALCAGENLVDGVCYPLSGSPCEQVLSGGVRLYPSGVRTRFPDDRLLEEAEVEGYVGMTVGGGDGGARAWMAVMDRQPLAHPELAAAVLEVCAHRVAAELERRRADLAQSTAQAELEERVARRTRELQLSEEKFSKAFQSSPQPMVMVRYDDARFVEANDAFLAHVGYPRSRIIGRTALEIGMWADPQERASMLERLEADGQVRGFQFEYRAESGERRLAQVSADVIDVDGQATILASLHDVTATLNDVLTGLPNRALFLDRVGRALERGRRRSDRVSAVLSIDLDRFRRINDSLGHQAGDQVLIALGRRLRECIRPGDTVARLAGDEFGLLLDDLGDHQEAERVADRVREMLASPFLVEGEAVYVTACLGIALSHPRYDRAEDVLRDADTAVTRAKLAGRGQRTTFTEPMRELVRSELRLEGELRDALERGQFELHYQPILSLGRCCTVTGFESLLRWRHPDRGLLAPASFVALAEETGMIVPIGAWALAQACRDARRWLDRYPCVPPWVVTVNLSCRQLEDPELVQRIAHTLRDTRLPPESLMLEITEGALIQDPVAAAAILGHVRALGVRLSIDDFGTGYSSLAYLQDLPVDALKIDRSFVSRPGEGGGREIVRTIVAMAHGMSKEVIAEGVERADQVPWLRELGCDYVQGFLWSPAVAPADAEAFLAWRPAEWM